MPALERRTCSGASRYLKLVFVPLMIGRDQSCDIAVLQDTDLSRNMPGKVKVSAPNLLAAKKK